MTSNFKIFMVGYGLYELVAEFDDKAEALSEFDLLINLETTPSGDDRGKYELVKILESEI